jgi:hypothetical protein
MRLISWTLWSGNKQYMCSVLHSSKGCNNYVILLFHWLVRGQCYFPQCEIWEGCPVPFHGMTSAEISSELSVANTD